MEVRQALGDALDLAPEERAAFVERLSVTDPELHHQVEHLLACEPEAGLLLPTDAAAFPLPEESSAIRTMVGPYRIVREAGRGGMGVVYEAERSDGQYTRRVAIKLLPTGSVGGALTRRFLSEREILAQLEHPGIARMFDGGITDSGEPYLVMEFVDGKALTAYAREASLNVIAKLRLFLDVCRAVSYAHGKLVVHRDLKPGNILVTRDGVVKLLDFGLARMLESGAASEVTQTAFRIMTPAYASPEQIHGMPFGVSGDVFSLGVVLYELLAGQRPFGAESSSPGAIERAVCEREPPPMIRRDVPADLKTIVGKALEKDPNRRYPSVEALAADIANFLDGRPISARRPSWTYLASKFVRRHRWAVLGAASASLLIAIFGVIAALEARRAQRRSDDVLQLANSVVFELHDTIARLPGSTKARELVVRRGLEYLDRLSRETGNDPSLLRQLSAGYLRLGDAQGNPGIPNLGNPAGAKATYRKALAILEDLRERYPSDNGISEDLVDALLKLAFVVDTSEALTLSQRALRLSQADAAAHPGNVRASMELASSFYDVGQSHARQRQYPQSASAYKAALETYRELDRRIHSDVTAGNVSLCLKRLGALALVSDDLPAALASYQEACDIDERLVAANPGDMTLKVNLSYGLSDLGTTLRRMNRTAEAEDVYQRVVALRREAHRADPDDLRATTALATILMRYGELLFSTGRVGDAVKFLKEAEALCQNRKEQLPEFGQVEFRLAEAYERLGGTREAAGRRKEALEFFDAARQRRPLMPNEQEMYAALTGK